MRRPSPRRSQRAVSPVVATILLVAITIVLTAILYVFATGLLTGGSSLNTPQVTFGFPTQGAPGVWSLAVAGASRPEGLVKYEIEVYNGTQVAIPATDLDVVRDLGVSGGGLNLTYTDVGGAGSGKLTAGDAFTLRPVATGSRYEILLLWKQSGNLVQTGRIG
jgi:flagellin-like protein